MVVGLACFDYAVLFTMPDDQAAGCYSRLFHSFCVRGWLAKELKNIHMDDFMEFMDDIRFVYWDELHFGPKIEDMKPFFIKSGVGETRTDVPRIQVVLFVLGARGA